MKKIFVLSVLAILMLSSCQTSKQTALNDLRALSRELALHSDTYSYSDWTKAGKEYHRVNKKISDHISDYNETEFQEIAELNGKCTRSFTEGAITKISGAVSAIKSFVHGFNSK